MIPEGWRTYKLGEIAEIIGGGTPSTTNEEYWNGTIPWLTPRDLTNYNFKYINKGERSITESGLNNSSTRMLPKGAVLLTSRAPIGYLAIAESPICTNQGFKSFITDDAKVDNQFLYYLLKNNVEQIKSFGTGTTFAEVSGSTLKGIEFDFPEHTSEQSRIASILSSIDDKIELNLQMNKTLEAIAQAIFKEWFNDPKTVALSEYIQINPSLTIKKDAITKYVEMRDIPQVGFSIDSFIKRKFSAGSKFQNMDTLLARITPCLENGKTAFVDNLEENEIGFGSTEFIVMRANKGISPYAVYLLARNENFRAFAIKSMSGTSGRQRVQSDLLKSYQVAEVDSKKMQKFDLLVKPLFVKIKSNSDNNQTLSQLRDILLPKLMTGKIRV